METMRWFPKKALLKSVLAFAIPSAVTFLILGYQQRTVEWRLREIPNLPPPPSFESLIHMNDPILLLMGAVIGLLAAALFWVRDAAKSMEERCRDRIEMQEEFLENLCHTLRRPLTPMKGYLDILLDGRVGHLNEKQIQSMRTIAKNTDRLQELIDSFLDLQSIESMEEPFQLRSIKLSEILEEIGHDYRVLAEQKGIHIKTDIQGDLQMYGEPQKLRQLFSNLVANAVLYTTKGIVEIKGTENNDDVYVEVCDTGIGIDPRDKEKVFHRFFRSQDARVQSVPGSGLGLSIAHSIIRKHKGRIDIESTVGKGATFRIVLPKEKRKDRRRPRLKIAS